MAVSLPPCGAKVTIKSSATCASFRRGESTAVSCRGCRELSLKAVDCASLWKGKGHGLARFVSGGELSAPWCRKELLKRCAVVRCYTCFRKRSQHLSGRCTTKGRTYSVPISDALITFCACQQVQLEIRGFEKLFNPGDFDASKLTVKFVDNANNIKFNSVEDLLPRKYTLTHSDVTGELLLSIGPSFNRQQLTDWYTRLMRDEIVAEWRGSEQISLHVHCHVSGGHVLLAPAALRNSIFEREMPLVLEAIRHGDKDLLAEYPELHASTVWVHFHSSDPAYNRADCWGPLFYAASPIRRVTGKLVPSCISEPFTPLTLVKVQKDPAELCSVMSP